MTNYSKIAMLGIVAAVAFSCSRKQPELIIKTTRAIVTDAVPSGSGLAYFNDTVFIVGDDAEFIGLMSGNSPQYTRKVFYPNAVYDRIEKPVKHDLESATLGSIGNDRFLFAFGSGGISPYRDTMFAVNMHAAEKTFKRSLLPLYNAIRARGGLSEKDLNIEGAAIAGDKLLLFNRGKNLVILISWPHFTEYIQQPNYLPIPEFTLSEVSLPVINNFPVGISGACALNENEILFTASLEETKDFIQDGTIKGSYIGLLHLDKDSEIKLISLSPLKDASGNNIIDKLESIEVIKKQGRNIEAVAVADNDDGKSKLFYLHISKP